MGLFNRIKRAKGRVSAEETARAETSLILEALEQIAGSSMRYASTMLSDIHGKKVIRDLTPAIREALGNSSLNLNFFPPEAALHAAERSFCPFASPALKEAGRVRWEHNKEARKFQKVFKLSDRELSIVIDSVCIIRGASFGNDWGRFAVIAEELASQRRKSGKQKR